MAAISRPPEAQSALFFRVKQPLSPGAQVICAPGESAVLLEMGRVAARLGPGTHAVQADGPVELVFVSPGLRALRFGGKLGTLTDPASGTRYEASCFGAASFRVTDPAKVVLTLASPGDADGAVAWAKGSLVKALPEIIAKSGAAALQVVTGAATAAITDALRKAPAFASVGLELEGVDSISFNVDEATLAALKKAPAAAAPVAAPAPAGRPRCGSCGADLAAGAKFCTTCGKPAGGKCGGCGAALSPGAKFCASCGAKA